SFGGETNTPEGGTRDRNLVEDPDDPSQHYPHRGRPRGPLQLRTQLRLHPLVTRRNAHPLHHHCRSEGSDRIADSRLYRTATRGHARGEEGHLTGHALSDSNYHTNCPLAEDEMAGWRTDTAASHGPVKNHLDAKGLEKVILTVLAPPGY